MLSKSKVDATFKLSVLALSTVLLMACGDEDDKKKNSQSIEPDITDVKDETINSKKAEEYYHNTVMPHEVSYDESKITYVSDESFYVDNQYSFLTSYSEQEVKDVLLGYPKLTLKYFLGPNPYNPNIQDEPSFMYIEVMDEESAEAQEQLAEFGLEKNIKFEGQRFIERDLKSISYIPNDGSKFNDGGDNWHLEFLQAPKIWDITRGSKDILVGVNDGGINASHEELKNRVNEVYSNSDKDVSHGNGSSSTIVANSNNGKGISGINHNSNMVFSSFYNKRTDEDSEAVDALCKKRSARVFNGSYGANWNGHLATEKVINELKEDYNIKVNITEKNKYDSFATLISLMDFIDANITKEEFLDEYIFSLAYSGKSGLKEAIRTHTLSNPANRGCLVIMAAGNDAYNARISNGVLNLDYNGDINTNKRAIVVGAILNQTKNGKRYLASYSNYGDSVDIYAPTEFKAASINDYDESFSGTSAATPAVSGIASLIYSINPNFSTKDVKDILISTADTVPAIQEVNGKDVSRGNIKVINGLEAVREAKRRRNLEIDFDSEVMVDNPITGNMQVKLHSEKGNLVSVNVAISASNTYCPTNPTFSQLNTYNFKKTFTKFDNLQNASHTIELPLNKDVACYVVSGTAIYKKPGLVNQATYELPFTNFLNVQPTKVIVKDQTTLQPIINATVSAQNEGTLTRCDDSVKQCSINTDTNGQAVVYLESKNTYKIFGKATQYKDSVQKVTISSLLNQGKVELMMSSIDETEVGHFVGKVVDTNGKPIKNATVRVSGGEQTNGYFASNTTNDNGVALVTNIVKNDSEGQKIPYFTVQVTAEGYKTQLKKKIIILDGKASINKFVLIKAEEDQNTYGFDFENGAHNWQLSGLWNTALLNGNSITNSLVPNYTSLAPNEKDYAFLPKAHSGNHALWFGNKATGSFIGQQISGDSFKSGGNSVQALSGSAVTHFISLKNKSKPILKFWTWWEIESINPNKNGFDLMKVMISTDNGQTFKLLRKLNPEIDPNDSDREHKPMSSGGYNRKPVWVQESIDLSDYEDKIVQLKFEFDTVDTKYNGFRGWVIDDIYITND